MQTLPTTFRSGGFDFRQLKRQGNVALFEKSKPAHVNKHYELVIVQNHEEHQWPDGRVSPAREALPRSEDWGKSGWTPPTLEAAEKGFDRLVEAANLQHASETH